MIPICLILSFDTYILVVHMIFDRLGLWLNFCDGCNLFADFSVFCRLCVDRILLFFLTAILFFLMLLVRLLVIIVGDHQVTFVPSNIFNLLSLKVVFVCHPQK